MDHKYEWQGLMYVQDEIVIVAAISRYSGSGPWQAWKMHTDKEPSPIGKDHATIEDAQRAIEREFQE